MYAVAILLAAAAAWAWVSARLSLAACAVAFCALLASGIMVRSRAAREAAEAVVPGLKDLRTDAARQTRKLSDWLSA